MLCTRTSRLRILVAALLVGQVLLARSAAAGDRATATVSKSYVHAEPSSATKKDKVYLVKGDIFRILDYQAGFYRFTFTNKDQVTTEGFLSASESVPLDPDAGIVSVERVTIYPSREVAAQDRPYVVRGDVVEVILEKEGWSLVRYAKSSTVGWVQGGQIEKKR